MAVHGKNTLVMIDENDLSTYFNDVGWSADIDAAETTTFSSGGAKTYIAGLGDGKISASGIFDGTAVTGSDARLAAAFANTDNSVLLTSPQGSVLGAQCKLAAGLSTTYEVASKVSDVVETKAEFQANGGVDSGQILAAARSVATATTTNETSVDRGASTANGGVAQLHRLQPVAQRRPGGGRHHRRRLWRSRRVPHQHGELYRPCHRAVPLEARGEATH